MASASAWACSSVRLGDELKQGIERNWATEYDVEFSEAGLQSTAWADRSHPFYNSPRGPKDGITYTDKGRALSLEARFGQRVKEKSLKALTAVHAACLRAVGSHSLEAAPMSALEEVLRVWHFELDECDREILQLRYAAAEDSELVNLKHFLAAALPRDFGHWLADPQSAKLDPRGSWVKWNSSRVRERGWAPKQ